MAPRAPRPASGRTWQVLALALIWLPVRLAWGQAAAPALAHLVQPKPGTRPLGVVLAELSRQGQLPFSYSSSLVPLAHLCTLRAGPARPLGVVLRDVLAAEHLSYGLLNGQLVLWPNRVAAPPGVAAVNGHAALPSPPASLAVPAATTFLGSKPAAAAKAAATGGRSAGQSVPLSGVGAPPLFDPAKPIKATTANINSLTKSRLATGTTPIPAPHPRTNLTTRSGHETRPDSRAFTAKQLTALPGSHTTATRPRSSRSQASSAAADRSVPRGKTFINLPSPTQVASQPPLRPRQIRGSLPLLPPRFALLASGLQADSSLPTVLTPLALAPGSSSATGPAQPAESTAKNPPASSGLLARRYLHGEAWLSETLPLNAAVAVGIPQIHLVLGAAVGPFDHPAGWAWGVGLGTVGRTRGRFTPSLQVLHWFLSGPRGDQDGPRDRLTQLRPALAWQLKQGGRWQLVGGPTLNLATARRIRGPFPWPLGQNQWLWVNSADGPSLLRLWPGVQLGLRF
jgi:hypothetical protein